MSTEGRSVESNKIPKISIKINFLCLFLQLLFQTWLTNGNVHRNDRRRVIDYSVSADFYAFLKTFGIKTHFTAEINPHIEKKDSQTQVCLQRYSNL